MVVVAVVIGVAVYLAASAGGGPGVPACRVGAPTVEAVTPTAESALTLRVGSYQGTGSPQCIRGIGFQPVVVIIKGDISQFTVWRSISMVGDSTADFANGQSNIKDAITSLDPDAFSLGADETVNAVGATYYYAAFAASPDVSAGSYVGDGSRGRNITGVGFQPELVFLKWDGLRSAVWRSGDHAGGSSSFFDGNDDATNFVAELNQDGFQVSSDPWVNNGGPPDTPSTYHFVAFKESPGLLETGSYVGDGSSGRSIEVGFQPDYVWIKASSTETKGVHRTSSVSGDSTLRFDQVPNGTGEIIALEPSGFQVGAEPSVNAEEETYHYVAWKATAAP